VEEVTLISEGVLSELLSSGTFDGGVTLMKNGTLCEFVAVAAPDTGTIRPLSLDDGADTLCCKIIGTGGVIVFDPLWKDTGAPPLAPFTNPDALIGDPDGEDPFPFLLAAK